jgi:hypothetical protein
LYSLPFFELKKLISLEVSNELFSFFFSFSYMKCLASSSRGEGLLASVGFPVLPDFPSSERFISPTDFLSSKS